MEVLAFLAVVLGVILFVPTLIFIYQCIKYGPSQAIADTVHELGGVFGLIWHVITFPFTLIRDIFSFIAKLFKR
ncbi:hypothetical protein EDC32_10474 [Laceyella sacchari]|uniref:hypothetical protein n=1 Tax=Laceyella sacchari TaxID=37482 RepID=UPI00104E8EF5|nr:hypothetical protein [Laceyella sacchari]TCW36624.1 hypothetical protein EDC32_10474 [Laceyella sacchari]